MNIEDFINGNSSTEIDKLTTALGAAAEMLFIFFNSLEKAGFDYDEALTLMVEYMKTMFTNQNS